jgi:hypothetical protein
MQLMLDENASFLTKEQLEQHVSKLNREDFQSLDTEWEVAVLNAFGKLGKVSHEPTLEGPSRPDLLFSFDDGSGFLADITSVSDEGFEDDSPFKAFYVELQERLKKAGLLSKGWMLDVGEHQVKYGEQRKLALPPRAEFAKEIFNAKFKEFLGQVNEHPEQSRNYTVRTAKTAVSLTYDPQRTGFMSHLGVYNAAMTKDQNPVFNALKKKAKQLKKVSYEGPKGVILCDGGSNMIHGQPHGAFEFNYNAVDAAKDFLRQNQSIDFVILITSVWINKGIHSFARPGEPVRKVEVTIIRNKNFDSLPAGLKEGLEKLEQCFPEPVNTPSGARETIRHGFDPKALRPFAGGIGWSHNEIRISASAVLALLAGRITQEELFKSLDFSPWSDRPGATHNLFEYMLNKSMRIVEVQVEDTKYDDDTLVIKFEGPDPATSPYVNPKAGE